MKTLISLFAAAAMILPVAASAATFTSPLFSNGQTTIDATGGATVSGTGTLTLGVNEVCEVMRVQSGDPIMSPVDTSVGGTLGYQEQTYFNVPFSIKVSPNTGTFTPTVQCAGNFGGGRAINGGDTSAGSVIWLPATNLGTVRVVSNVVTTSTPSSDPVVGSIDWITAQFAKMFAMIDDLKKAPAPTPAPANPNCPVMIYNGSNAYTVQGWLMSHGQAGPFNAKAVYAPTGFWGTASVAAYNSAQAACAK